MRRSLGCTTIVAFSIISLAGMASAFGGGPECEAAAKAEAAKKAASLAAESGKPVYTQVKGSPFEVGAMAGKPIAVDVNSDGSLDIVLACGACRGQKPSDESGHVAIMLGDGKGGFVHASSPIKIAPTALKVAVADFNGDKKPDIACIEHDSYDVHLLFGDGRGGFKKAPGSPIASRNGKRPHTHDIAAADVNEDGFADMAVTNANDNTISILLGNGKGEFKQSTPVAAGQHPYEGLTFNDVNGDKHLDMLVTNLQGNAAAVLLGDGKAGFAMASGSPISIGERPGYLTVGDVNADGRADLVCTHDDVGLVDILISDGEGRFAPAKGSPMKISEPVWGACIADMDNDGQGDVVLASLKGNIIMLRGDGAGTMGPQQVALKAGQECCYVVVADFNKDGLPDVAASGDVSVYLATKAK